MKKKTDCTVNPHIAELTEWALANIPETCGFYILHFESRIAEDSESARGPAGHYTGSASNLRARFLAHLAGQGARLTEVANEKGYRFWMVRAYETKTEHEARAYESYFKNCIKNGRRHCPCCGNVPLPAPSVKTLDKWAREEEEREAEIEQEMYAAEMADMWDMWEAEADAWYGQYD